MENAVGIRAFDVRWFVGPALDTVAALLLLPPLFWGVNERDSSLLTDVWARQFAALMAAGDPYPRWLPGSFGGLGSPTFIFYPPLTFLPDGLVRLATGPEIPVSYRLAITASVLLWASDASMNWWLRDQVRPGLTLLGAVLFMAAPYHLTDYYWRGALAEFSSYAVIPIVLLGVRRAARAWSGVLVLAVGYLSLILAHLPAALLVTLFLLPAYALHAVCLAQRPVPALVRSLVGGLLGLALSALYLLPALSLPGHITTGVFWDSPYFNPNQCVLLAVLFVSVPPFLWIVCCIALSAAAIAQLLWIEEVRLWAGVIAFSLLALAGAVPLLWSISLLATVQLRPFRLLGLVEAAAGIGLILALQAKSRWGWRQRLILASSLLALLPALYFFIVTRADSLADAPHYWARFTPLIEANMMDGAKYLPPGLTSHQANSVAGFGPWTAPPPLGTTCPGASCAATRRGQTIEVTVSASAQVTLAQFAFPVGS